MSNPYHIQRYKGLTLSNDIPYQVQMDAIDAAIQKESNMYTQNVTVTEKTEADSRRQYFLNRLNDVRSELLHAAEKHFGLYYDKPSTPKELIEGIKAGEYTIDENYDLDDDCFGNPLAAFRWTKIKPDQKGYRKFMNEVLDVAYTKATDAVWATIAIADLPAIVEKFEKTKIH